MGQAIPFAAPDRPAWPDRTAALDSAECTLLVSIRWWVVAFRDNAPAVPRLRRGLAFVGAADAALSVDSLMAIAAASNRHPLAIHWPRCTCLSDDELVFLHAASLVQHGDAARAGRVLAATLLTDDGAAFACAPLAGLGTLFAGCGLRFSRRRPPIPGGAAPDHADCPADPRPGALPHSGVLH